MANTPHCLKMVVWHYALQTRYVFFYFNIFYFNNFILITLLPKANDNKIQKVTQVVIERVAFARS